MKTLIHTRELPEVYVYAVDIQTGYYFWFEFSLLAHIAMSIM